MAHPGSKAHCIAWLGLVLLGVLLSVGALQQGTPKAEQNKQQQPLIASMQGPHFVPGLLRQLNGGRR
jgi:hypothetical protein